MNRDRPTQTIWPGHRPRCVVMCGGRSSRFTGRAVHKSMAMVDDTPLLRYVIDYWSAFTDDFLFVVKNGKDAVVDFASGLPIEATFVEPDELRGIADGLCYAEPKIDEPFIMALGDCFCAGAFDIPRNVGYGIGVQLGSVEDAIRRNYAVVVEGEHVVQVVEKPASAPNDLCGMGFYFLQPDIFDHIRRTRPSARSGEVEITDVLQTVIDAGESMHAVTFSGHYVNVNTPQDLGRIASIVSCGESAAG